MFDFWCGGDREGEVAWPVKDSGTNPGLGLEHSKGKRLHREPQTELSIGGEFLVRCDRQER